MGLPLIEIEILCFRGYCLTEWLKSNKELYVSAFVDGNQRITSRATKNGGAQVTTRVFQRLIGGEFCGRINGQFGETSPRGGWYECRDRHLALNTGQPNWLKLHAVDRKPFPSSSFRTERTSLMNGVKHAKESYEAE
jgi:hypothetical protein